jgi:hypothetical protein
MVAMLPFSPRKALVENSTAKITINNLSHAGSEKTTLVGKALVINLFKRFKMIFNAQVILGFLRFTGPVNRRGVGEGLVSLERDTELPDNLYCKLN